jgi:hypothetical protein
MAVPAEEAGEILQGGEMTFFLGVISGIVLAVAVLWLFWKLVIEDLGDEHHPR